MHISLRSHLVEELSNCYDCFLRLSGFPDLSLRKLFFGEGARGAGGDRLSKNVGQHGWPMTKKKKKKKTLAKTLESGPQKNEM